MAGAIIRDHFVPMPNSFSLNRNKNKQHTHIYSQKESFQFNEFKKIVSFNLERMKKVKSFESRPPHQNYKTVKKIE